LVKFPKFRHPTRRELWCWQEECPFSEDFRNWHGPFNTSGIGAAVAATKHSRGLTMQTFTTFGSRAATACAAFALSLMLIGQTISVPQAGGSVQVASTYMGAVA
jgi:hypothetical protein